MGVEVNQLPWGWRKPPLLEKWLGNQFPAMEFICRRFKSRRDGHHYMEVKATIRDHPAKLRFHQYIRIEQLWRVDGFNLLLAQLWLVSPDH